MEWASSGFFFLWRTDHTPHTPHTQYHPRRSGRIGAEVRLICDRMKLAALAYGRTLVFRFAALGRDDFALVRSQVPR